MSADIKVPETLEEAQALLKAERETSTKYKERAIGAEKLIEKHKPKKDDADQKTVDQVPQVDVNKIIDEREFYAKNPEMVEHKEQLSKLTLSGDFSMEEAKLVLEKRDPTILSRKNANKANFTLWDSGVTAKTMSQEEFWKLPLDEFKRANAAIAKWEVKII